jgi:glycosyltransferase involved in cell wall biosynthesis
MLFLGKILRNLKMKNFFKVFFIFGFVLAGALSASEAPSKKLKILLVTDNLMGLSHSTGLGTYNYHLVTFLKNEGHNIDVLYLNPIDAQEREVQQKYYEGIAIHPLPEAIELPLERDDINRQLNISFRAYRWARDKDYDVIFYPDCDGQGYCLTEAKRQGYAFEKTMLVVTAHGPKVWLWSLYDPLLSHPKEYIVSHIEQKSVEHADIVLCNSLYSKTFLEGKGWQFPTNTKLLPGVFKSPPPQRSSPPKSESNIKEVIFIGRLNLHKGIDLFTQTLKKTYKRAPELTKNLKITFLGSGDVSYFKDNCPELAANVQHITNLDARGVEEYTQGPGRLVMFTSRGETYGYAQLEALLGGTQFIGLKNGTFEEFIQESDVDKVLTPPLNTTFLSQKLEAVLKNGCPQVKPKINLQAIEQQWRQFLAELTEKINHLPNVQVNTDQPLVSVCIPHFNRPDQLMDAIKSLEAQDYKNFEVLVMDDGSSAEVVEKLKKDIEPYMQKHGWRIFYQENQYLSAARNNLVPHAKGKYIFLMDDDDILLPDALSRAVNIALRTNSKIVTSNQAFARQTKFKPSSLSLFSGSMVANMVGTNTIGGVYVLIDKQVYIDLGGYLNEYGFGYSDQEFYIRAYAKGYKTEISLEPFFIYNLTNQEHMGKEDSKHYALQIHKAFSAYAHILPKEFAEVPFWIFSLNQELESKSRELGARGMENIPLKKVIRERIKMKIKKLKSKFISFFK